MNQKEEVLDITELSNLSSRQQNDFYSILWNFITNEDLVYSLYKDVKNMITSYEEEDDDYNTKYHEFMTYYTPWLNEDDEETTIDFDRFVEEENKELKEFRQNGGLTNSQIQTFIELVNLKRPYENRKDVDALLIMKLIGYVSQLTRVPIPSDQNEVEVMLKKMGLSNEII